MNYLVMECHPGYAVLLDEEGRFLKAANLRYETGQTVYDSVLMKETPERQRHTVRWISSGIAAIAACLSLRGRYWSKTPSIPWVLESSTRQLPFISRSKSYLRGTSAEPFPSCRTLPFSSSSQSVCP